MKTKRFFVAIVFLPMLCVSNISAQVDEPPTSAGGPPKMVLLVHQEFMFGKTGERQKLGAAISRACDHLKVPNDWIDLESLSGPREALFFDPFDSFEHLDKSFADWSRIYATHLELSRMQERMEALVTNERTIIAARRDDLGYQPLSIDFSKARFLRVLEVRLIPGHESDFVEAFRILSAAYERIKADTPWVVYQVNVGMPSPAFLVFVPLRALKQNDDLLYWRKNIREAEGEEVARQLEQIAHDAYSSTESNLYAVSPETSHVSKDFADGDPEFWSPKLTPNPSARKSPEDKP